MRKNVPVFLAAGLCLLFVFSVSMAEDGKALYDKKCALCHGKDGVAKKMAAGSGNFNDAEWQKANSAEEIAKVTAEGKNKMKPYKDKLSDEEIKLIAEYIKTL